jgi:hypothetical protein
MEPTQSEQKTPGILILLAWLFVGIPLAWGVSQTMRNAMNLFNSTPPAGNPVPLVSGPSTTQPHVAPSPPTTAP